MKYCANALMLMLIIVVSLEVGNNKLTLEVKSCKLRTVIFHVKKNLDNECRGLGKK
jgi:hypothetical protein